ncbi:S9 family peptidase [Chengkuizengella marina]|uniref:S9 family peptidase n=1 Tax=Chengkuizengella marina TaxID=2507566 RepID=A0A6N9Q6R5_9BACL|nr:prolyl oligopeptidase family serine peptidase [Chengkuizengella marina]NBI30538.1 S9 family peptidase [Chengkuizengella marina]
MIQFKKPDVEHFFRTLGIQQFKISPDETQCIFSTNISGKYNLWAMDLPQMFPYPLTFIDQSCQDICYDKQGRFIIASFDHDGDENTQLYALQTVGGELKPIRVQKGKQHLQPMMSDDGSKLYYTSNKDNETFLNTYLYNLLSEKETVLHQGKKGATYLTNKSPDELSFTFLEHFSNTNVRAFVKKDGEDIYLTPREGVDHTISDMVYTSENEIYFTTDFESDFSYLARFDLQTKQFTKVKAIEGEEFTMIKKVKDRNLLYLVNMKGVIDRLYQFDLHTKELSLVHIPVSVIDQIEIAESGNVYILGRTATNTYNIYKKEETEEKWIKLTNYGVPGVSDQQLVEPEVLTYPSFDGLEIEALLFKAREEVSNGHVVLWPHGGPQAAERQSFRALFQFLTYYGFSIFAPNFRGSTGYGLSFKKMVERNWGDGPRHDNIEGLEFLFKNKLADRDKVFLMGGSFGGYMSLLLHGRHPEYFKAVVDIFGPSNLFTFINSVPEHWKPIMDQWVGNPEKDKQMLIDYSPDTYLETMTKPMLIIQGANDPRVVKAESDQIVEAIRNKGREVEYIVFDDEGHGFSKKENEIKTYRTILDFFNKYL